MLAFAEHLSPGNLIHLNNDGGRQSRTNMNKKPWIRHIMPILDWRAEEESRRHDQDDQLA
jgi:hypothetical protein